MTLDQDQEITLTLNTHIHVPSFTHLVACINQLSGHRLHKFLKNPLFSLFSIEKPKLQNLTLSLKMSSWETYIRGREKMTVLK